MKRFSLLLFLFCFSSLAFFSSGIVESQDGLQYLTVARKIYYDHVPLAPDYEYPAKNIHMNVTPRADGKYYSPTGAGYSLAMLPAVAISDVFHKIFQVQPPEHFPLESDFMVLLFASFTNIFFVSILAVILYHYGRILGVSHRIALLFSLLGIVCTNLFPLAKHGFAHMMFITFLTGSFYFIKRFAVTRKPINLTLSAASFGLVVIAYNPTFVLSVPALVIYYLLYSTSSIKNLLSWMRQQIAPAIFTLIGIVPFIAFYFWFNALKTGVAVNSGYGIPSKSPFLASPKILFEGVYGLLLSPGRSFFLYSPLVVLPVLFWHKLPFRKYWREFTGWGILAVVNVYFFAIQNSGLNWLQWSGETSWGPRYIALLIPFFVLAIMIVWQNLSGKTKLFIGLPIILAGIGVQMLGVLLPYQIKFHGLQSEAQINNTRFTFTDYGNFIPRYSPLITMPRELAKRIRELPGTVNHGRYKVQFVDGVDYPFKLGGGHEWRGLFSPAYIEFTVPNNEVVTKINLALANTKLQPDSTRSAEIVASIGNRSLGTVQVEPEKWNDLQLDVNLLPAKYTLQLDSGFVGTSSAQQVVFLRGMMINDTLVSLESLDLPYVQPLAQKMSKTEYRYFGNQENTPWFFWHYRSRIYEGTLDIWWIKALYYSDWPKWLFVVLFAGNTIVWAYSGIQVTQLVSKKRYRVDQIFLKRTLPELRKRFRSKRFRFQGVKYQYFVHPYNATGKNERAVEVPIIAKFLTETTGKKVLEIGNVLAYYGYSGQEVVDKYEVAEHVMNADVVNFHPKHKYDLILSISTLEHVGWDETPKRKTKIIKAINHLETLLRPDGKIIFTIPVGYNPYLDALLKKNALPVDEWYGLLRVSDLNTWVERPWQDLLDAKYNTPYNNANAILVGVIHKRRRATRARK